MRLPVAPISVMNFFFLLGLSVVLAIKDNAFASDTVMLYEFLGRIANQEVFASVCFIGAIIIFASFLLNNCYLEMLGLFWSGIILLLLLAGSLLTFPNIGSVTYAVWTLSAFMTIVEVYNRKRDDDAKKRKDEES